MVAPNSPLSVAVAVAALIACARQDPPAGAVASAATTSAPPHSASATIATPTTGPSAESSAPSALAGAGPNAAPSARAEAPSASAASSALAGATPKAAPSAVVLANPSGVGECGKSPLPSCPLQGWMKENMTAASNADDAPALAVALEKSAALGPTAYTNWASIAKDGAKAAKAGDLRAAKRSCKTCHEQYKTKYKAEMRTRRI